jgi:hypothetical protein
MVAFLLTWLANSKAIAFFCGRGPLVSQRWTWAQLVALYAMPLLPADPGGPAASGGSASGGLLARSAAKTVLTVAALAGLAWGPPKVLKEVLYVLAMYGWLGEWASHGQAPKRVGCGLLWRGQQEQLAAGILLPTL